MKTNVGKRIKEIAGIIEKIILIIAAIEGIFIILGGFILLCSDSDNFLISLVVIGVGFGWIWLGKWLAEVSTIVTYGFGIIVDKMEHWSPAASNASMYIYGSGPAKKQILANGGWQCSCGRVNASDASSCYCGKNKRDLFNANLARDPYQEQKVNSSEAAPAVTKPMQKSSDLHLERKSGLDKELAYKLKYSLTFNGPGAMRRYLASIHYEDDAKKSILEDILDCGDADLRKAVEIYLA